MGLFAARTAGNSAPISPIAHAQTTPTTMCSTATLGRDGH